MMTQAVMKAQSTGNYYLMILHYIESGDKYLLTLKNLSERCYVCRR